MIPTSSDLAVLEPRTVSRGQVTPSDGAVASSVGAAPSVYANTSRPSLNALRRVAQAVAESSPSPADMSGTRRLSHIP